MYNRLVPAVGQESKFLLRNRPRSCDMMGVSVTCKLKTLKKL